MLIELPFFTGRSASSLGRRASRGRATLTVRLGRARGRPNYFPRKERVTPLARIDLRRTLLTP